MCLNIDPAVFNLWIFFENVQVYMYKDVHLSVVYDRKILAINRKYASMIG